MQLKNGDDNIIHFIKSTMTPTSDFKIFMRNTVVILENPKIT